MYFLHKPARSVYLRYMLPVDMILSNVLYIAHYVCLIYCPLTDVTAMLSPSTKLAYQRGDLSGVVYADDTLLISMSSIHLEEYLLAVAAAGERYGMELHWDKFQLLAVHTEPALHAPSGDPIP